MQPTGKTMDWVSEGHRGSLRWVEGKAEAKGQSVHSYGERSSFTRMLWSHGTSKMSRKAPGLPAQELWVCVLM